MPVANLTAELMGTFPRLPFLHSLGLLNRAWARMRDLRLWSWQIITDAQLFAPALITAGTVTTQAFSTAVSVDVNAAAAINAAPMIPPVSGTVGFGCQLRITSGNSLNGPTGPYYNILNWDGVSQLTLDRPFGEGSLNAVGYQIGKVYYAAPSNPATNLPAANASAIKLIGLTNKLTGYSIRGRKLRYTQAQLNAVDPQRGSGGDPYIVAEYGVNLFGQPVWELYPAPSNQTTYYVDYFSRWPDLSNTQDFPQVPYALSHTTMDLARAYACDWALANAATYPELQQTNWVAARNNYKQEHIEGVRQCFRNDDEILPQAAFSQAFFRDLPLGGTFLQSHDVSSLIPGGGY